MDLQRLPIARELFAQWRRARGDREAAATRPFTRKWSELLEDAGLISALDQSEAEQDVRSLAAGGWIEIKPVRYKSHLMDRVAIPLQAESRWCEAFGFSPMGNAEAEQIRNFSWEPELSFVPGARLNLSFEELRQLNLFFLQGGRAAIPVPIKERSLQVFGDEKRLDILHGSSAIFAEGRLTLDQLHCFLVAEPLGWKRGAAPEGPVIVLENLATWESYRRWDASRGLFSAIVYGGGKRFIDSAVSLRDLFGELGGPKRVLYFGDLDPAGVRIPRVASARACAAGLPAIEPDLWSYRCLFERAKQLGGQFPCEQSAFAEEDCLWLGPLASAARALFSGAQRIPQELIGWEFLQGCEPSGHCHGPA
jgi:hypothetical protein